MVMTNIYSILCIRSGVVVLQICTLKFQYGVICNVLRKKALVHTVDLLLSRILK